jgi:hypothetical protein
MGYPSWNYYPRNVRPAPWAIDFTRVVANVEPIVSTHVPREGLTSDVVLASLAPGLSELGYSVERNKTAANRIRRPVLFGPQGQSTLTYEIDAFHDELGVVVEVEAGRGARGNAVYRDIVRTSLILDATYLALAVPIAYRHKSGERLVAVAAFKDASDQFDAIYASQRLRLPFDGVLLVGY